ncbi:RsiV family protein [Alkanindiges sp. WGS2144]|uniref:RsiV family protein n=1 Tax=Alkanindiges sp. WGS2144 TaxID=3366808 RepID=UPI00375061D9
MNKVMLTYLLVLSSGMMTTACQKHKEVPEKPAASDSQSTPQPHQMSVKQVPANYKLPACEGEGCPEVDIQRLQTSNHWVNQFVDREILQLSSVQLSEEQPKPTSIQDNVDRFLQAAKQDSAARGAPVPYSMQVTPEYLGQKGDIALLKISAAYYTGGAHGSALDNYYNLDLKQKKQLGLDDILVPAQRQQLHQLFYQQFVAWIKENDAKTDLDEYEQTWPFKLTDNFTFDLDGLKLSYAQYEIGPYVVGMPEFTVPYAQLNGIIKPEYLKAPVQLNVPKQHVIPAPD